MEFLHLIELKPTAALYISVHAVWVYAIWRTFQWVMFSEKILEIDNKINQALKNMNFRYFRQVSQKNCGAVGGLWHHMEPCDVIVRLLVYVRSTCQLPRCYSAYRFLKRYTLLLFCAFINLSIIIPSSRVPLQMA